MVIAENYMVIAGNYMVIAEKHGSLMLGFVDVNPFIIEHFTAQYIKNYKHYVLPVLIP